MPLKFTCHGGTSTATLLNKGELHCEDSAKNITCPIAVFAKFTCNRASGYVARCIGSRSWKTKSFLRVSDRIKNEQVKRCHKM